MKLELQHAGSYLGADWAPYFTPVQPETVEPNEFGEYPQGYNEYGERTDSKTERAANRAACRESGGCNAWHDWDQEDGPSPCRHCPCPR